MATFATRTSLVSDRPGICIGLVDFNPEKLHGSNLVDRPSKCWKHPKGPASICPGRQALAFLLRNVWESR